MKDEGITGLMKSGPNWPKLRVEILIDKLMLWNGMMVENKRFRDGWKNKIKKIN